MRPRRLHFCWSLLLTLAPWWSMADGQARQARLKLPEVAEPSPFLQRTPPGYRNFALRQFTNPPDHSFPFSDRPRAYFGSMGTYLITGYEVYTWTETRVPGQQFGSRMFKDLNAFRPLFDHVMVARDGWGDWGISAIVGDGLIARFTPLTLSKVDFNGLRLDLSTPDLQVTALASRLERQPANPTSISAPWNVEGTFVADSNTLLLGGRAQTRIGALRLGLNGVNLHVYQSTRPGNSLKGRVRPDHPLIEFIVVRVADDSPADGHGAVVQELSLILDGEVRPDLPPPGDPPPPRRADPGGLGLPGHRRVPPRPLHPAFVHWILLARRGHLLPQQGSAPLCGLPLPVCPRKRTGRKRVNQPGGLAGQLRGGAARVHPPRRRRRGADLPVRPEAGTGGPLGGGGGPGWKRLPHRGGCPMGEESKRPRPGIPVHQHLLPHGAARPGKRPGPVESRTGALSRGREHRPLPIQRGRQLQPSPASRSTASTRARRSTRATRRTWKGSAVSGSRPDSPTAATPFTCRPCAGSGAGARARSSSPWLRATPPSCAPI